MTTLDAYLSQLGLSKYQDVFTEHGFDDIPALLCATETDLEQMGLPLGHRRKLLASLQDMKKGTANGTTAGTPPLRSDDEALVGELPTKGPRIADEVEVVEVPLENRSTAGDSVHSKSSARSTYSSMSRVYDGFVSWRHNAQSMLDSLFGNWTASTKKAVVLSEDVEKEEDRESSANALGGDDGDDGATRQMVRRLSMDMLADDEHVRAQARKAFESCDERVAKQLCNVIAHQLKSKDVGLRTIATRTLGNLGMRAEAYADKFAESLSDTDNNLRRESAAALGRVGPGGIKKLERALMHPEPSVREAAAYELGKSNSAQSATAVAALLVDENVSVRGHAVIALGRMGEAGFRFLTEVANLFADPEPEVQKLAKEMLSTACGLQHGRAGKGANHELRNSTCLLSHKEAAARILALRALANLGAVDGEIDAVARLVSDEDDKVAKLAGDSVSQVCQNDSAIAVRLLKHSDKGARHIATEAVGGMGEEAAAHADIMAGLLRDEQTKTRENAARALGRMGAQGAKHAAEIARVVREDPESSVRAIAIVSLGQLGDAGKVFGKDVLALGGHKDEQVRVAAAQTIHSWMSAQKQS